jgi:ribonucleotide monophosphatase NagD (HAD superfamily)
MCVKEVPDPEVGAVVCGWDLTFNYAKLCLASLYMQKNEGCVLVATNKDAFDRLDDRNMPGKKTCVGGIKKHTLLPDK